MGEGGTGGTCQAIVKPGKEQLGFNMSPPVTLVAELKWMPDLLTAVLSTHGDRG